MTRGRRSHRGRRTQRRAVSLSRGSSRKLRRDSRRRFRKFRSTSSTNPSYKTIFERLKRLARTHLTDEERECIRNLWPLRREIRTINDLINYISEECNIDESKVSRLVRLHLLVHKKAKQRDKAGQNTTDSSAEANS